MPYYKKRSLSEFIPSASPAALSLIEWMLKYNPKDRPTADELMNQPYF